MDSLLNGEGLVWKLGALIVLAAVALGGIVRSQRFGLIFLGALLFLSGMGLTEDADRALEYRTWLYVLQVYRQYAYAGCSGLLLLGAAIHTSKLNAGNVPSLGFGMMILGVYMGIMEVFHAGVPAGIAAVFFAILSIGAVLIMLAGQLKTWDDFIVVLRVLAVAGCLWAVACAIQFVFDPSVLTTGYGYRRFVGLSGNPQHAAGLSAVMTTLSFWLLLNDNKKLWKFVALAAGGTHLVMVLWTASRTGLALTSIGYAGVLYARLGRAVFLAPVAGAVGYGLLLLVANLGIEIGFERLSSREDTRSDKWTILWETGMQNPIVGVGLQDAGGSENGFLYAFASFGIGTPVILAAIMLATGAVCLRLIKARFDTPDPTGKRIIDLTLAFFAMYWAGNMFEGFGVARISPQLTYFLVFACFSSCAITISRDERAAINDAKLDGDDWPAPIKLDDEGFDEGSYGEVPA
jgi:hypothetical protein